MYSFNCTIGLWILCSYGLANSAINSLPLSSKTCVGHGYLFNKVCLITLAIMSACLVFISAIYNHPVMGSIMVGHHNLKSDCCLPFLFTPLRGILYGPIRSTHGVSQG